MDTLTVVLLSIATTLAVLLAVFGVTVLWLRRKMARFRGDLSISQHGEVLRGPVVANYRGLLSEKVPVKGNGALVLTQNVVWMERFLPRGAYVVPLDQVQSVELRQTWKNSYRAGRPVLVVHFVSSTQPNDDALGVMVRDADAWALAIARAAGVGVQGRARPKRDKQKRP